MDINILGCCYSRELFNYQKEHCVKTYVLQQSLFTMFASPLPISLKDARSVDNTNFMNRMMYYEFNKLGLTQILNSDVDKLIIDFADCRYDIYELEEPKGCKIIYTHDARATFDNIMQKDKYANLKRNYVNVVDTFTEDKLLEVVGKLCDKLLQKYKPENIILNKVNMAKGYYENGNKFDFVNNFHLSRESFIHKVEDIFLKLMPECKVFRPKYDPIANINHRFGGPHPLHFEDIYYQYKMDLMDNLISGKDREDEINENYLKVLNENLENIKSKVLSLLPNLLNQIFLL